MSTIEKSNEVDFNRDRSPLLSKAEICPAQNDQDKLSPKLTSEKSVDFLLACISMTLAIFSAGSIGPVFKYMESLGIRPCLAASWR